MSFLYPLGLVGLVGIPILIIIYIIKSKYAEQTVSSTYLWTLSEKFLKRKKPISPLAGLISLILQILTVTAISLIIARPIITIPDSAKEYCFVLDASGSMNIEEDGVSRFERAKDEIEKIVDSSRDGSKYTLIVASDVTSAVVEKSTDKKEIKAVLSELGGGYASPDYTDALGVAQKCFDDNPGTLTYLVTDTDYASVGNISIINVAKNEQNAAIKNITWNIAQGELSLGGDVESFGINGNLTVSAYADGAEEPFAAIGVTAKSGECVPFKISHTLPSFTSLKLTLSVNDSLSLDNEYIVYNVKSENSYRVLLVSESPFFIETALSAAGYNKITVIEPEKYTSDESGYGLYIFDSCTPKSLPSDGAVWFFNPVGSTADSGFTFQSHVTLDSADYLEKTSSSSSVAVNITEGVDGKDIAVKQFAKCNLYRGFTTLFSYKGNPVIFAGNNVKGHREVVVAFDLHNSNLPLLTDFIVLINNFMNFSFPSVLEKTNYSAGENAEVNIVANCDSVRVQSPSGAINYLNTDSAVASFPLSETGSYDISVTVSGVVREYNIYSSVPSSESNPQPTEEKIELVGAAEDIGFDGTFDPLTILIICLVLLFLADWMVYCYEKYQLR